jgi:glycosyltransferase involved in cell wall biosynthesis
MRTLLESGFDIDIFPFYPRDEALWRYVPDILNDAVLSKDKVHHVGLIKSMASLKPWPLRKFIRYAADVSAVTRAAVPFGLTPLSKSIYVFPKAWAWSRSHGNRYDHVLAYWGNYAASCAYVFHRLMDRTVPFSMFLHAGIDLYQDQVYLREKLLYSDNIIVVCDFNRQFIQQRYPQTYPAIAHKIFEYHLGLDFADFPFRTDMRPRRKILAVGILAPYKGYEYLLKAASELVKRGVSFELELAGDGPQANDLKVLAERLNISHLVRFTGWLPPQAVRTAMQNATVFVHPSNGLGDAVPTVIKECLALGTPVVASDTAGIPELLDHGRCGVLVPPQDTIGFADAIQRLLEDDALREMYAKAGRQYAEGKFDLWRNGKHLADLLHSTRRGRVAEMTMAGD